jgi:hypothetical protein
LPGGFTGGSRGVGWASDLNPRPHQTARRAWQEEHGKPGSRADAARRIEEAHRLLDEIADTLVEMRRELLGGGRQ